MMMERHIAVLGKVVALILALSQDAAAFSLPSAPGALPSRFRPRLPALARHPTADPATEPSTRR